MGHDICRSASARRIVDRTLFYALVVPRHLLQSEVSAFAFFDVGVPKLVLVIYYLDHRLQWDYILITMSCSTTLYALHARALVMLQLLVQCDYNMDEYQISAKD